MERQYFDVESGWNHNGFRDYLPQLGRYIEPDPLGRLGSGNNLYAYVDDDPIDFLDPLGEKVTVTQNGNTIDVNTSITLYGPRASDALAATWQQAINNAWNNNGNNFHYGHCTVNFDVTVNADPNHNKAADATPADNKVYVRPSGFRDFTSRAGGTYGEWAVDDNWAATHEAGHLFDLPDDYRDNAQGISVPNPGHAGHMMGQYGGHVVQHEINDILHNNQCGCRR
jgi:RHS repeat-associated protein